MHDLDHLMSRGQALQDILTNCSRSNPFNEALDDLEIHIGLEQGDTNLLEGGSHIRFAQDPFSSELLNDSIESL